MAIGVIAPFDEFADNMHYHFFIVELKTASKASSRVKLSAPAGFATCLAMVRRLNIAIAKIQAITAIAAAAGVRVAEITYSAIITNRFGQILITWHDGSKYQVQDCASSLLTRLAELCDMHRCICRIIELGMGERLDQIQKALDLIADNSDVLVINEDKADPEPKPKPDRKQLHPRNAFKPQRRSSRLRNK